MLSVVNKAVTIDERACSVCVLLVVAENAFRGLDENQNKYFYDDTSKDGIPISPPRFMYQSLFPCSPKLSVNSHLDLFIF